MTPWTVCSLPGSSVHGDSPGNNTGVSYLAFLHGIFPTQGLNPGLLNYRQILYPLSHQGSPRILGWVAFPFSRGPSQLISLHRYVDVGLVISTLLVISLLNFLRCMYKKTGSRELGRILSKNKTNFSGNLPLLSLTSH